MIEKCLLFINGEWVSGVDEFTVTEKFTGERIAEVAIASRDQVYDAVAAAEHAFRTEVLSPYERYGILQRASSLVDERRDELVQIIIAESGFTYSDAVSEAKRCVQTLLLSGEEAKRIHGDVVPLEAAPGHEHRLGFTIRVPIGVVCAITPFNAPFNTVAHKIAPALAAGNAVVLKPASYTPMSARALCRILLDAGLPKGHLNVVHGAGSQIGAWLFENQTIGFYAFTGSSAVGKIIQASVGLRRTSLELGSISSTIVCEDADLKWATPRCINAAFRKAGQVCTSMQRLYVHESIIDGFMELLVNSTEALRVGDPYDPNTIVGPMIASQEADRAEGWIHEAVEQGAKVLAGGRRHGSVLHPTILVDVRPDMRVMSEEIFAPVISIVPYTSFEEALESVNDTPYGLTAGVFTMDINKAMRAAKTLRVGTVHINESSSSRIDMMPSGGVKESGIGREGPKYAIEEMSEERLVTISLSPR